MFSKLKITNKLYNSALSTAGFALTVKVYYDSNNKQLFNQNEVLITLGKENANALKEIALQLKLRNDLAASKKLEAKILASSSDVTLPSPLELLDFGSDFFVTVINSVISFI